MLRRSPGDVFVRDESAPNDSERSHRIGSGRMESAVGSGCRVASRFAGRFRVCGLVTRGEECKEVPCDCGCGCDCGCDEAIRGGWDDGSVNVDACSTVAADRGLTFRSRGLVMYGESGSSTLSWGFPRLPGVLVAGCGTEVNVVEKLAAVVLLVDL